MPPLIHGSGYIHARNLFYSLFPRARGKWCCAGDVRGKILKLSALLLAAASALRIKNNKKKRREEKKVHLLKAAIKNSLSAGNIIRARADDEGI